MQNPEQPRRWPYLEQYPEPALFYNPARKAPLFFFEHVVLKDRRVAPYIPDSPLKNKVDSFLQRRNIYSLLPYFAGLPILIMGRSSEKKLLTWGLKAVGYFIVVGLGDILLNSYETALVEQLFEQQLPRIKQFKQNGDFAALGWDIKLV